MSNFDHLSSINKTKEQKIAAEISMYIKQKTLMLFILSRPWSVIRLNIYDRLLNTFNYNISTCLYMFMFKIEQIN